MSYSNVIYNIGLYLDDVKIENGVISARWMGEYHQPIDHRTIRCLYRPTVSAVVTDQVVKELGDCKYKKGEKVEDFIKNKIDWSI
jgi:hypothetical protein